MSTNEAKGTRCDRNRKEYHKGSDRIHFVSQEAEKREPKLICSLG